jgi:acetyl-CoA acetyltransferase family protein
MCEYVGTPSQGTNTFGKFKDVTAIDLAAHASKAALQRAGVPADAIEHVVIGNALQTSPDAIYGARHVALKAGVPIASPALTVNRLCGSGIQSIVNVAQMIQLGEANTALAGGMENMSQAPFCLYGTRSGIPFGVQPQLVDMLFGSLKDPLADLYMAQTAENLARRLAIPRDAQDEYALRSHQLGAAAVKEGRFGEEIAPVTIKGRKGDEVVTTDDHIKPDTSLEALSKLRPAFGKDGTVTAGNASGIVDGAAAVVLTTAERAKADKLDVFARIVAWGIVGVDPKEMGIGPVPAIRQTLERAKVKLGDVGRVEINEAFSAQYLACEKELGLQRERCNVNGGAISLGHPLGATGTRLVLTLMYELRRANQRFGIASACIGGGQGIAILIENPRA